MASSQSKKWIQVRFELYRQVYQHVQLILGESKGKMRAYEKAYESQFFKAWRSSSRQELLEALLGAQVVLLGDFHALHQSQKAHLRIFKSLSDAGRDVQVGVECIEARQQKTLDRFMEGKITEKDFLKAIDWKKAWGFPWEHYRPFFRWAQKHKVKVVGLNTHSQKSSSSTLKQRDFFAAEKILEMKRAAPHKKIFVIYGDLHLARPHLPASLKKKGFKKPEILTIFQNSEKIYFQMLSQGMEDQVDVVKLAKDQFCLQNVPPWVKWQNYQLFLEEHLDKNLDDEIDLTDVIAQYVRLIAEDLGIPARTDHFSIVAAQSELFWRELETKIMNQERQFIKCWIEQGRSFYLPQLAIGFLARTSVNNASQLAISIVLAGMNSLKKIPSEMPQDFVRLIWLEAIQYFGSKLVNPKRKTDTLADIKTQLSAANPDDQGKAAMRLALSQKMLELMYLSGLKISKALPARKVKLKSYQEAARILGGILGEKMYFGYRQKRISRTSLVALFSKAIDGELFPQVYWEILETIETLPEPFKSKTEKI